MLKKSIRIIAILVISLYIISQSGLSATGDATTTLTQAELQLQSRIQRPSAFDAPIIPHADYNILNMEPPEGYFVADESTLQGYSNGRTHFSSPSTNNWTVPSKGYEERLVDNGNGVMDSSGGITYPNTSNDMLERADLEGFYFPLYTKQNSCESGNSMCEENQIYGEEVVTIYYPQAIKLNGETYDIKAKFSDFQKTSDSYGAWPDGFYTTFYASHYFYSGFWMVDFQSLNEEITIYDSNGDEVNLEELYEAYGMFMGMFSLNGPDGGEKGDENHEAIEPVRGLGAAKTFENVDFVYNTTLGRNAYEGLSDVESNGVAFELTSGSTIAFNVAKNPAAYSGKAWWNIGWFAPAFWASHLPAETDIFDEGDAPYSYGAGKIKFDPNFNYDLMQGLYLGFDPAGFDELDDVQDHVNALGDDLSPNSTSLGSYDDESGFVNKKQDASGFLNFNIDSSTINLTIPYENTNNIPAQIIVWIDFNNNGTFEASEGVSETVSQTQVSSNVTVGSDNLARGSVDISIPIPVDAVAGETYMRAIITADTRDLLSRGNSDVFSEIGEVEDYPVKLISSNNTCSSITTINDSSLNYTSFEILSDKSIKYIGVSNPYNNYLIDLIVVANVVSGDSISLSNSSYAVDPNGVIIALNGGDLGSEVEFTINAYKSNTTIPANIALEATVFDMDNSESISSIAPYSNSYIESDGAYTLSDNSITPNSSIDIAHNNGSKNRVTFTTPIDNEFKFNYKSTALSDLVMTLNYPSVYEEYASCPSTEITKSIIDESFSVDGIAQVGEEITYKIDVINSSSDMIATDVMVRDSLLENLPSWLSYDGNLTVSGTGSTYSGNLGNGDLILDYVDMGSTVSLTYKLKVLDNPPTETSITNVVTDNGLDPNIICPLGDLNCDSSVIDLNPDTIISKALIDESITKDGIVEDNETLTYQISVTNTDTDTNALLVSVRDSLLEGLPDYVRYDGNVVVSGDKNTYTGSLQEGSFVLDQVSAGQTVTVSYSVDVLEVPVDVVEILNMATDNDKDPIELCLVDTEDCATIVVPVNPTTTVKKSIVDESIVVDGIVEKDEYITYNIDVTNTNDVVSALNVQVRDSILENLPPYIDFDRIVTVTGNNNTYTGDLTLGTFKLDKILPGETVTISYRLKSATDIHLDEEIEAVYNVATDNGSDPTLVCELNNPDCDSAVIVTNPSTIISKSVVSPVGFVKPGDTIKYQVEVKNTTTHDAVDVKVRDSLVENLPAFVTYNDDISVVGSNYVGDLISSNLIVEKVSAKSSVYINYSVTLASIIPDDVSDIVNVVTDDGSNPDVICESSSANCAGTISKLDPDTTVEKVLVNESIQNDGIIENGELLTYNILITNTNDVMDAINVSVRDSLLENLPSYVTYDGNVLVSGDSNTYKGNFVDGTFVLDKVAPNQVITIEYSVLVDNIPSDVTSITNIVTDNGSNPTLVCVPTQGNCDLVTIPTNPLTNISKVMTDSSGDGVAQFGEVLNYTIRLDNPTNQTALNVLVRDSLLQDLPSYLTYNNDLDVVGATYSGDILSDGIIINQVYAKDYVLINYSLTVGDVISDDIGEIINVATDNSSDPSLVCQVNSPDCMGTTIKIDPETTITKTLLKESIDNDGIVEDNESLTYEISVTNFNKVVSARDVSIRDNLLENLPNYITYDGNIIVEATNQEYTGTLPGKDFVLEEIKPLETVKIRYTVSVKIIPDNVESILNVVTDNGSNPNLSCEETSKDCDSVIIVTNPSTVIYKRVTDSTGDKLVSPGEVLKYTIVISNNTTIDALDVVVRDSMLEQLPSYLTFNNDLKVAGSTYTGDLITKPIIVDHVVAKESVYITYSVTMSDDVPLDVGNVVNIATDDGSSPTSICEIESPNCDDATIKLQPNTIITKELVNESIDNDGIAQAQEELTYEIKVKNANLAIEAVDVSVRDSMLENLPAHISYDGNLDVSGNNNSYTGNLVYNTFKLDGILAGSTVNIRYTVKVETIPNDVNYIANIVTDTGLDPIEMCRVVNDDCNYVIIPTNPSTIIEKAVVDTNGDSYAQTGENLEYTIKVSNNTTIDALDVLVRDNLLENTPDYLRFNNDLQVLGATYSGSLDAGTFVLDKVGAKEVVYIKYSMHVKSTVPTDVGSVENIVTDNGSDPSEVCVFGNPDCYSVITPIDADTVTSKQLVNESIENDGIIEESEELTYSISITNKNELVSAYDVIVRDSMLENLPSYVTFDSLISVTGNNNTYKGSLRNNTFVLDEVKPMSTVVIEYKVHVSDIPKNTDSVWNAVTDNGSNPSLPCPPNSQNCSAVVRTTNPSQSSKNMLKMKMVMG